MNVILFIVAAVAGITLLGKRRAAVDGTAPKPEPLNPMNDMEAVQNTIDVQPIPQPIEFPSSGTIIDDTSLEFDPDDETAAEFFAGDGNAVTTRGPESLEQLMASFDG